MATPSAEDKEKYQDPYQSSVIDVNGTHWSVFGNALIGFSTFIMIFQNLKIGPQWVWTIADDVTTVLFTFELLVRVLEKGYLFVVEEGKYWNFFDTLVVGISLGSMIVTLQAGPNNHHEDLARVHHKGDESEEGSGGGAASKLKVLRVLRLLRLLRLLRVLKGIEKVTGVVDLFLKGVAYSFIGILVSCGMVALIMTMTVALGAGGTAWLKVHHLPSLPKIK